MALLYRPRPRALVAPQVDHELAPDGWNIHGCRVHLRGARIKLSLSGRPIDAMRVPLPRFDFSVLKRLRHGIVERLVVICVADLFRSPREKLDVDLVNSSYFGTRSVREYSGASR